jgi:hypothetical protein
MTKSGKGTHETHCHRLGEYHAGLENHLCHVAQVVTGKAFMDYLWPKGGIILPIPQSPHRHQAGAAAVR